MGKEEDVIKDILVRKGGNWKAFLFPVHKKIIPVIIPAGVLGFISYNLIIFFMGKGVASSLNGKLFLIAIIFLYLWVVIFFFILSSLVYTMIENYPKKSVMERLKFEKRLE